MLDYMTKEKKKKAITSFVIKTSLSILGLVAAIWIVVLWWNFY